jgi:hypothetical protein
MLTSLMMLAVEANGVVALRMMKLMRGGKKRPKVRLSAIGAVAMTMEEEK